MRRSARLSYATLSARQLRLHHIALVARHIVINCLLDDASQFFEAFLLCLSFAWVPAYASGVFGQCTALLAVYWPLHEGLNMVAGL